MTNREALRKLVLLGAMLAAVAVGRGAWAEEIVRQSFAVGGWQGYVTFDTASELTTCHVDRELPDGAVFGFFRNLHNFGLRLGNRSWKLGKGDQYPVLYPAQLRIDDGRPTAWVGYLVKRRGAETVEFYLDDPEFHVPLLQAGRTLSVTVAGQTLQVSLAGARDALAQLKDCRERNIVTLARPPIRDNPLRSAASPAAPFIAQGTVGMTASREHVVRPPFMDPETFRAFFAAIGYPKDSTVVERLADDVQADWGSLIYTTPDGGLGTYWEENSDDPRRDNRTIAAGLAARWRVGCRGGKFATSAETPATVGSMQVQSGLIGCRQPAAAVTVSLIDTGPITHVFMTIADDTSRAAAQRLDRGLRETWVNLLSTVDRGQGR